MATVTADDSWMQLAVELAKKGVRGANPLVGAVLVDRFGNKLAEGWHRGAGSEHAEIMALRAAQKIKGDLSDCCLYVSLEPCHHTGRTPPCSRALLASGIGRIVYGQTDTTAAAGGATFLAAAGLELVQHRAGAAASEQLNRRWIRRMQENRPWVLAKLASSLDGFCAAADGTSQWITGRSAREDGHRLRAKSAAILVGSQTIFTDNPRLSARDGEGQLLEQQPIPVVMGYRQLPKQAAIFADKRTILLRTHSPRQALAQLKERGIEQLLIEGGPTVLSAFLAQDLLDELYWYLNPSLLGAGLASVADIGVGSLAQAQRWVLDDLEQSPALRQLGQDLCLHMLAPR